MSTANNGWVPIGALLVSALAAGGVLLSTIFATKTDLPDSSLQDWRLKTLEVRVENLDIRQQRTDQNVVLLLDRFKIRPAPEPQTQPLPVAPLDP